MKNNSEYNKGCRGCNPGSRLTAERSGMTPHKKNSTESLISSLFGDIRERGPAGVLKKRTNPLRPICHPKRKHYAHGLCQSCYNTKRRRENPEALNRHKLKSREYSISNRETKAATERKQHLKSYGLTPEDFGRMIVDQDGKCLICGERRPLQVDHNHTSGEVRGLLCLYCNVLSGWLETHGENLDSAIAYLTAHGVFKEGPKAMVKWSAS
jgi:hypothetical protein